MSEMRLMTATEAEPYARCFTDAYWDNNDGVPISPQPYQGARVNTLGRKTLRTIVGNNDGLIRLSGPRQFEGDVLAGDAEGLYPGMFVKGRYETIGVTVAPDLPQQPPSYSIESDESGYAVMKNEGATYSMYSGVVNWFIVAETGPKSLGFFRIPVDYEASFDAGPYHDHMNMVKIRGRKIYGLSKIILNRTFNIGERIQSRATSATLLHPQLAPEDSRFSKLRRSI